MLVLVLNIIKCLCLKCLELIVSALPHPWLVDVPIPKFGRYVSPPSKGGCHGNQLLVLWETSFIHYRSKIIGTLYIQHFCI